MAQSILKTAVVHGATGLQGGSVTRALAVAGYTVRATVRDVNAPKAQELAKLPNVELVPVDLSSVSKLAEIYTGADAVFACTVPGPEEMQQGKNMADAALQAGIKLFLWSALESVAKLTADNLKISIPIFDAKSDVADYLATLRGLNYTNLYLGGFMENLINFPNHSKYVAAEDAIELQFSGMRPDVEGGLLWVEKDLPSAVQIILSHPSEFAGQSIALADIRISCNGMATTVQRVSGRTTRAVFDAGYNDHIPAFRLLKDFWNGPYFTHYKGWPSPHPLLAKYGFQPALFEGFAEERLLPHLGL
ncbi:NAD(P)-binding protein [Auricularia subglabra TFB-10046 SS5]|nr:NAD(P)-binding protein [Auricularia subglabra TFB-10046 SS5]